MFTLALWKFRTQKSPRDVCVQKHSSRYVSVKSHEPQAIANSCPKLQNAVEKRYKKTLKKEQQLWLKLRKLERTFAKPIEASPIARPRWLHLDALTEQSQLRKAMKKIIHVYYSDLLNSDLFLPSYEIRRVSLMLPDVECLAYYQDTDSALHSLPDRLQSSQLLENKHNLVIIQKGRLSQHRQLPSTLLTDCRLSTHQSSHPKQNRQNNGRRAAMRVNTVSKKIQYYRPYPLHSEKNQMTFHKATRNRSLLLSSI